MRLASFIAPCVLTVALGAPACLAQTPPTLVFVQPLSAQSVLAVQNRLGQLGTYTGPVDGVWGPDSEAALERFQQSHQLQATGQMNQATAATLGLDPASLFAVSAAAVVSPPPPPPLLPPATTGSVTLSAASVRVVQNRLAALNFYTGAVDGEWGASTQTAIERFQKGRGLEPNGQLNPATISALGLAPAAISVR